MSNNIERIENALKDIDSATFQKLCDSYVIHKHPEILSYNATGSQIGKRKTVKGTPDSFLRKRAGELVYIEYTTTDEKSIVKKIIGDLEKCNSLQLQENAQNTEVFYFFNCKLNPEEESIVHKKSIELQLTLNLININILSHELCFKYPWITAEFLDIKIGTQQIVPLCDFVENYTHGKNDFAIPLDNPFYNREVEILQMQQFLFSNNIVVVLGQAGVGKTKLAIESIFKFNESNQQYRAFSVVDKGQNISDDIRGVFSKDDFLIFLLDDGYQNKNLLKQLLALQTEWKEQQFKIVFTVRGYLKDEFLGNLTGLNYQKITLNKLSNEEIKKIVDDDYFGIKNYKYQDKIIHLSKGNPRLAIMSARIALQIQSEFLYGSIGELFSEYYRTFVKDKSFFNEPLTKSVLALISFFGKIELKDDEFINDLCLNFEIDRSDFKRTIQSLDNAEFLEILDQDSVKLGAQESAYYFFYRGFIGEENGLLVLNFFKLLLNYFENYVGRFHDTIIPCINSFGYDEIKDAIHGDLARYLLKTKSDSRVKIKFYNSFWFFLQPEIIRDLQPQIRTLPEQENPEYEVKDDFTFSTDWEEEFFILTNFVEQYDPDYFTIGLNLILELVKKKPHLYKKLITLIKDKLVFNSRDIESLPLGKTCLRQRLLWESIVGKAGSDELYYRSISLDLIEVFLPYKYSFAESAFGTTFRIRDWEQPINEDIINLRRFLFELIPFLYSLDTKRVNDLLRSWIKNVATNETELVKHDFQTLREIFEEKYDNTIENKFIVNSLISELEKKNLEISLDSVKEKFKFPEYDLMRGLLYDYRQYIKETGDKDYKKFEEYKDKRLANDYTFNDQLEAKEFAKVVELTHFIDDHSRSIFIHSIEIIIAHNYERNREIGILLLSSILNFTKSEIPPFNKVLELISQTDDDPELTLKKILENYLFPNRERWEFIFLHFLQQNQDINLGSKYLRILEESNEIITIIYRDVLLFAKKEKEFSKFMEQLFEIVIRKNKSERRLLRLHEYVFYHYGSEWFAPIEIVKEAYFQQLIIDNHFDYDKKGCKKLIEIDNSIFFELMNKTFAVKNLSIINRIDIPLSFVWTLANYDVLIISYLKSIAPGSVSDAVVNPVLNIFTGINDELKGIALEFLLKLIEDFSSLPHFQSMFFEIVRERYPEHLSQAFAVYIARNRSLTDFNEIHWTSRSHSGFGNEIFEERNLKVYEQLYAVVKEFGFEYDEIKFGLVEMIEQSKAIIKQEKKRKFFDPFFD